MGNSVNLTFSHFEMEDHYGTGNCSYDFLSVTEGDGSTELGKFCGLSVPERISSSSESVLVHFQSDYSVAHNGFRLGSEVLQSVGKHNSNLTLSEWAVEGCGGILTKPNGILESPNYPNIYPSNVECLWYIQTRLGQSIELNIEDFYLEGDRCQWDFLAVYGGPDDSSPQLTRLCNRRSENTTVTSQGNNMMIRFKSDSAVEGKGFRASYRTRESKCGGLVTGVRGVITSPNYPHNYDSHDDCGWLVTVDRDHVVQFTFEDFDVEPHSNCSYDHVALYDGNSTEAPLLLMHCGRDLPSPAMIKSTSNQMFVRLKADGSVASKGFKANYTRGCGASIVTGGQGVLESPDWPHSWQDLGSSCDWVIRGATDTDRVTVTFTFLHLTNLSPGNCSLQQSHLDLHDGEDAAAPLLGRYCGSHSPPPVTSHGSALYMHVTNLPSQAGHSTRFRAVYTVEETACGGELRSESGRVTSPGFPDSYPPAVECVWSLAASTGNRVQLNFEMLNIEESENCNEDYVDIYRDGPDGDHVGRYCGETLPTNLTAANKFWIKFNSDSEGSAPGFVLHYNLQHGTDLSGETGEIQSPLYPLHYTGEDFTFSWTVSVAPGKSVEISFLEFDLEHGYQCYYSHLTVYDGPDDNGLQLFRDCRVEANTRVVSSSNVVHITLRGEGNNYGVLFRLKWRQVGRVAALTPPTDNRSQEACGGNIQLGRATLHNTGTDFFISKTNFLVVALYYGVLPCDRPPG